MPTRKERRDLPNTNGGLVMLAKSIESLPASEKKIADYILKNPQEVVSLTVNELARKSGASAAAVIRLCKSLNVAGFQELKMRIVGDLQTKDHMEYRDIAPNEGTTTIIEKMTNNTIQTILETAQVLRVKDVEQAVEAIVSARTIHFFGVGASAIIAEDAQQKFLRINKNATAFTDTHMVATMIANAKPDDVVMGISYSGATVEVASIIELANKKGITTISLTKYGHSLISDAAKISLYAATSKEATFRSGATSSRIAQLHVIDILFMSVATLQFDQVVKHIDETREAIQFLKEKHPRTRNRT